MNFVNNFSDVSGELIHELKEELKKGDLNEAGIISDDVFDNLQKIKHHGHRASEIVKAMLQHSRTSTGEKEPTDINALCDEYLRLAYHGMKAKDKEFKAEFKLELDESLPKVNVVPQDMGRVLLNLFNNAFFACNEKSKNIDSHLLSPNSDGQYKPQVEVSSRKVGDKIEIIVKDNGPGIPEEISEKIFQPFFTTKPTGQGTGLGLSLSYDIITKGHNGTIEVESIMDQGTEFIIHVPA